MINDYFTREAFKGLRTNILFCGTDIKVITLTSCEAHEGKTTISMELARAMAESGKRVLLIDADMRKSVMIARYAEEKGVVGLSQYLSGMSEKEEVVFTAEDQNFDIIFAGKFPPNPVELLGSKRFKELLESERENYDYIFIDAPPLGLVVDAAVIAANSDGAIIVVSTDTVKYRFAQNVKNQLQKSGCQVLGVVLNHIHKRSNAFYKRYYQKYQGYGYYSNYGQDDNTEELT